MQLVKAFIHRILVNIEQIKSISSMIKLEHRLFAAVSHVIVSIKCKWDWSKKLLLVQRNMPLMKFQGQEKQRKKSLVSLSCSQGRPGGK